MPVDHHLIAAQHRVAPVELEGRPIPERVYLGIEMDGRRIECSQRRGTLEEHTAVGIHRLRHLILYRQGLGREDAVVRLLVLLFLVLFLLPLLYLLLLGFQSLGIRCLGHQLKGVCLGDQLTQRVRHQVLHRHLQRVLVDQQRVAQPVSQCILLGGTFQDKRGVGIEIQATENGQLRITIAEKDTDTVRLLTLHLQQITVGLYLLEGHHENIIGIEMRIRHLQDIIDM